MPPENSFLSPCLLQHACYSSQLPHSHLKLNVAFLQQLFLSFKPSASPNILAIPIITIQEL